MSEIVRITKGQPFAVFIPLVVLNADGTKESVAADTLTNVSVTIKGNCGEQEITPLTHDRFLVLNLPADLQVAVYAVSVTATLWQGRQFSLRIQRAFEVVNWDWQSNWRDYLVGDHIELNDQLLIAGYYNTDEELEALKEKFRQKIAQLDADIAEYEQKLHDITDIATKTAVANHAADIENGIMDWSTSIVNSRSLPYSIVCNGAEYYLEEFLYHQGHQVVYWAGAGGIGDVYTANWDYARIGDRVYSSPNLDSGHIIGTISAVNKVTLADIYDRIGNIDFSTLAKEQTLTTGLQTLLTAISSKATKDQLTGATSTILEAVQNIDFTPILDDYAEQLRVIIGEQSTGEQSEAAA